MPSTNGTIFSFLHPVSPSDKLSTSYISGTKSSVLYKAADSTYNKQYLLVSTVGDVESVDVAKVCRFWEDEKVGVVGSADVRVFRGVEVFGGKGEEEEGIARYRRYERDGLMRVEPIVTNSQWPDHPAHTLLIALMQPAPGGAAELDAWYREEHNQQMSQQPGWRRTCRYSLVAQRNSSSVVEKEKEFSFLAIHEFDEGNELGDTVKALEPVSEWTKKVMSEAEGIDAAIYHRVGLEEGC